jgi:nucleoside-diphosphate-sugar epimerase
VSLRVLVAGGAGFIGSHVCESLINCGHSVICLDNELTGKRRNIEPLLGRTAFRYIHRDVEGAPDVEADVILHLASPASPKHYYRYPLETLSANSAGTRRLLELAEANGAHFVYASTSEVYGDPLQHPQTESYWGNVNPIGQRSCYDEGKRFGEALTMSFWRQRKVNATIVRIFNTYGPRMDPEDGRAVPEFIRAALRGEALIVMGDGSQTRSFCYVDDLVRVLLLIAKDVAVAGQVFNIGNPAEITVVELAEAVMSASGSRRDLVFASAAPDDPAQRRPDISRVHERYGWQPGVPLTEGLKRTIEYFRTEAVQAISEVAS